MILKKGVIYIDSFVNLNVSFDDIELFIFDMDGTIYLDTTPIEGAIELIKQLKSKNINYVFLTNNSSKSASQYIEKLNSLGFLASHENVFTSGEACGMFLESKKKGALCYVVGTALFKDELRHYGIIIADENCDNPDFLIVGYDTELEYKKLIKACELLQKDVPFIATNCDLVCPMGNGSFLPDCGLFCHMLTVATKKEPFYIGKPKPNMIEILLHKHNISPQKTLMIGDRLYTDIAAGVNANVKTALVLTGESTLDDLQKSNVKPTFVLNSVKDICL